MPKPLVASTNSRFSFPNWSALGALLHDLPSPLMDYYSAALDYYAAMFEPLEATLLLTSRERVAVEQTWMEREIAGVVAGEARHEKFERWEAAMRAARFAGRPLSPFALSQARLLLRLHYPSEGCQLQVHRDSFFLGW